MAAVYNTEVSEDLLLAARLAVRANRTSAFDNEIRDLISAARAELVEIGVLPSKVYNDDDPLTKQAVILYVKAEFGLDNPDAERYHEAYTMLKHRISLLTDYTEAPDVLA